MSHACREAEDAAGALEAAVAAATSAVESRAAALEQQLGAAREALKAAEQRVCPTHVMLVPCALARTVIWVLFTFVSGWQRTMQSFRACTPALSRP